MENFKKVQNVYAEDSKKILLYADKNRFNGTELVNIVKGDSEIMSNDAYAFYVLKKIMPHERVVREILTYEMLNYEAAVKADGLEEIVRIAVAAFYRYQYKVGGYNIEDKDWILVGENNCRFKLGKGQKVLYNTVSEKGRDKELDWFMKGVADYVQAHADEGQYTVRYRVVGDERYHVCWVMLVFTDLGQKVENEEMIDEPIALV